MENDSLLSFQNIVRKMTISILIRVIIRTELYDCIDVLVHKFDISVQIHIIYCIYRMLYLTTCWIKTKKSITFYTTIKILIYFPSPNSSNNCATGFINRNSCSFFGWFYIFMPLPYLCLLFDKFFIIIIINVY